eukprot:CAMPEP_0117691478 /NCGR_PEP_ID=MMETSP0804-20121206/25743_1 /TAXON_ID=1074897 /ORGANISM="Tetraselmis astigmatica, Strain CCMP880" /LENGTH=1048 /DNA_ID=CAMNT_0005504717 /DNA_START=243 /DNA_END=3386 /DNA_ORIENTATION=+
MKRGREQPGEAPAKAGASSARDPNRKYQRGKTQMIDATSLPTPVPKKKPAAARSSTAGPPAISRPTSSAGVLRAPNRQRSNTQPPGPMANNSAAQRGSAGRFHKLEEGIICDSNPFHVAQAGGGDHLRGGVGSGGRDEETAAEPSMPSTFSNFQAYLEAMEPLMIEEAREGARSAFGESCEARKLFNVEIASVQNMPGHSGWCAVTARFIRTPKKPEALRDGSLFVLINREPPRTCDACEWVLRNLKAESQGAAAQEPGKLAAVMAVLRGGHGCGGRDRMPAAEQRFLIHPAPLRPGWEDPAQAMAAFPQHWWAVPAGDLVTVRREIDALRGLEDGTIATEILDPSTMAKRSMAEQRWPQELIHEGYHDFLHRKYDFSQIKAIEEAVSHLENPAFGGTGPHDASWRPFTLIQGPPGTGKTHTVRGILNTWHLVQYQRYYDSLVACLAPKSQIAGTWRGKHGRAAATIGGGVAAIYEGRMHSNVMDEQLLHLEGVEPRPRVLVCAPSNAATDELLQRIMNDGFRAANGSIYHPAVVRVGSGAAPLSDRARDVWVDNMVKQYLSANSQDEVTASLQQKSREVAHHLNLLRHKGHLAMQEGVDVEALAPELAALYDSWYKARQEIVRLSLVLSYMQTNRHTDKLDLELELVEHAEIIFTTLSSSGRNIFSRLKERKYMRFETVLIDEACQACEVAALQPLMYGCRKCVLVGDPQQLPATVLSLKAKDMERSLFERMQQASCPVHMLMVQYRMHPEIRQFPSNHFYEGKLQDGKSVLERVPPAWYRHPLLKPYIFFDVQGKERRKGGKSVSNVEEAEMAVALYIALLHKLEELKEKAPVSVGVITPYRDQRDCLQQKFREVCGEKAKHVFIETVDSFQGRQLDVVMLSCVRASATKSRVGFVGDIRRMNVAITRAQLACWVLGDAATLKTSPTWHALIDDAEARNMVISDASARTLFPEQFAHGDGTGRHCLDRFTSSEYNPSPDLSHDGVNPSAHTPFPGRAEPMPIPTPAVGNMPIPAGVPDPHTAAMSAWSSGAGGPPAAENVDHHGAA